MIIKNTCFSLVGLWQMAFFFALPGVLLLPAKVSADGWDPDSSASASGSIVNTRHNLTISYNANFGGVMAYARNQYDDVCVYCHTPHGANSRIDAPLWNRTVNDVASYAIYDKPTTLMRPTSVPGPSSLTCLSCHDGTISIDSVLNMPGSGWDPMNSGLRNAEVGTSNISFLDQWRAAGNSGPSSPTSRHMALGGSSFTCASYCHNPESEKNAGWTDFTAFVIGEDLRNDHPIGILYPDTFGPGVEFNPPDTAIPGKWAFFDTNGNNHADTNEVRLYDSGDGYEVECASCHDPHGVESGGEGSRFNPSFLRVNNGVVGSHAGVAGIVSHGGSALCLTCHTK